MRTTVRAHRFSVRNPDGRRHFGRPRLRWVGNIKMEEMMSMEWIDLALVRDRWRAVVNAVINLRFS